MRLLENKSSPVISDEIGQSTTVAGVSLNRSD
jgi:hypothetical protein